MVHWYHNRVNYLLSRQPTSRWAITHPHSTSTARPRHRARAVFFGQQRMSNPGCSKYALQKPCWPPYPCVSVSSPRWQPPPGAQRTRREGVTNEDHWTATGLQALPARAVGRGRRAGEKHIPPAPEELIGAGSASPVGSTASCVVLLLDHRAGHSADSDALLVHQMRPAKRDERTSEADCCPPRAWAEDGRTGKV